MQLTNFSRFIFKVIREGRRLQRYDINGNLTVRSHFSLIQVLSLFFAIALLWLLPRGLTSDFAGYIIAFLGIFIGLFSSIVVSLYDRSKSLFDNYEEQSPFERLRIRQLRNYLVQFTGLTAYSILIAIVLIVFLSVNLLSGSAERDIFSYYFVSDFSWDSIFCFVKITALILHRVITVYLLLRFFAITLFATSSYFAFLLSEYEKRKLDD